MAAKLKASTISHESKRLAFRPSINYKGQECTLYMSHHYLGLEEYIIYIMMLPDRQHPATSKHFTDRVQQHLNISSTGSSNIQTFHRQGPATSKHFTDRVQQHPNISSTAFSNIQTFQEPEKQSIKSPSSFEKAVNCECGHMSLVVCAGMYGSLLKRQWTVSVVTHHWLCAGMYGGLSEINGCIWEQSWHKI